MSQSKVTSFYTKRRSTRVLSKQEANTEIIKDISNPTSDILLKNIEVKSKRGRCPGKTKEKIKLCNNEVNAETDLASNIQEVKQPPKRASKTVKTSSKKGKKAADLSSQTKVTHFYESTQKTSDDSKKISKVCRLSTCVEEVSEDSKEVICAEVIPQDLAEVKTVQNIENIEITKDQAILQSPKRILVNPYEGTPPKKKPLKEEEKEDLSSSTIKKTPRKLIFPEKEKYVKNSPSHSTHNPKPKTISEETQKAIASFKEKIALIKSYEANPYKVTAVISPSEQASEIKSAIPAVPAYQRYSYLVDSEGVSSLILPVKYKLLSEMFRSMDTVVSILNNRKEKVTFDKVKEGVQKMMKRTFSKVHLGQIVKVMPLAYNVALEKTAYKKSNDPDYQLIITPDNKSLAGNSSKSKSKGTVIMTPQDLLDRKHQFDHELLNITRNHHKVFLGRLNFPIIPTESIKRWHPKFPVDSVPDIEVGELPEIPETKICTAKDVLNKFVKGSLRSKHKVVKALKSVAEESTTPINKKSENEESTEKLPDSKTALKGVCSDLIAKIRAKESAKLLQTMVEGPDEVKRKAMLERLPKIVQILWHYFIAERKAAVPVDTAVEKIIHSFNSLSTHEEVKAHLTLITETFPGWLSFIQIPKGLYITMDKNKNITQMLDNFHY